jgi:hypothetical protein
MPSSEEITSSQYANWIDESMRTTSEAIRSIRKSYFDFNNSFFSHSRNNLAFCKFFFLSRSDIPSFDDSMNVWFIFVDESICSAFHAVSSMIQSSWRWSSVFIQSMKNKTCIDSCNCIFDVQFIQYFNPRFLKGLKTPFQITNCMFAFDTV